MLFLFLCDIMKIGDNMISNNKGFTLVELVATVAIMALISIAAIPSLKNMISNNEESRFEYYMMALDNAARLYFNREMVDIRENINQLNTLNDYNKDKLGIVVCIDSLITSGLLEEIGGGYICHGGVNIVQSDNRVSSIDKKSLTYTPFLRCKETKNWASGEVVYEIKLPGVSDSKHSCDFF